MSRLAALTILLICALNALHLIRGSPLSDERTALSRFQDLYLMKHNSDSHDFRQKRAQDQENAPSACGYSSCPEVDPNRLNVHIIAHTHDDVGWLKTVDQYFYGSRKSNSHVGVQYILDSLMPQLMMDKEKRFIYVEMSFFAKWWEDQDEDMRSAVRRLVNEGRLEFANGGWCMNDEATVNYHSTIEQMTLGLKFLNETFGSCGHPKVGWQIDPFGHTNEQASLFAQFGFDGMYFTRIDFIDKQRRTDSKSLDFVWHGDRALPGQSGSIFANIFRDGYDSPDTFCFDAYCLDDPIVDNKKSYEYNLDRRGQQMIEFIRKYASAKLTNQLLIPFGGDFQYSAAGQNFKSLDKLMRYVRENAPDVNIFYSTPSCYHNAIHGRINDRPSIKLPEKYDDFMPYDSSSTVWWSGYFTSRPSVKLIEREIANLLQVSRMASLTSLIERVVDGVSSTGANRRNRPFKLRATSLDEASAHESDCLLPLWEVLGDLQHHDAVTGTEKQHVANDYVRRAYDASKSCAKFIGNQRRRKISASLNKTSRVYEALASSAHRLNLNPIFLEETSFCSLNISQCESLEVPVDGCYHRKMISASTASQRAVCTKDSLLRLGRNDAPREIERKGVLVTAYNPLATTAKQVDIRLPCIGRCDLSKIQVIHLPTNETMSLTRLSLPSGIESLPFRKSLTKFEVLFYVDIPPLGSTSFVISDTNEEDVVDDESTARLKRAPSTDWQTDCDNCESLTDEPFEYITVPIAFGSSSSGTAQNEEKKKRSKRDGQSSGGIGLDRVIVKFDMQTGMIGGLKRVSDGSSLSITQKFGTYSPAETGHQPGAYIFRANSTEPHMIDKPISFKMVKRNGGSLIEIHQKWADWIWQTIRVDSKKNYIEFDYVVGPVPIREDKGLEVVTRYITNMQNQGIFFTDSNGRQMLPRTKLQSTTPEQLGGSFFPVVSSMMIRSLNSSGVQPGDKSAEAVAVLVDRPQAGTSLNEGDLEFLVHRRHMQDDKFGVDEPLDEPGEDGRGLVIRGRHRLYLKFRAIKQGPLEESRQLLDSSSQTKTAPELFKLPRNPRANVTYELEFQASKEIAGQSDEGELDVYIAHDQLLNDLRQESVKYALRPVLTFDRLRTTANQFIQLLEDRDRGDFSLLNTSLPSNIHLLTLQPWNRRPNELLIRLENLDNPLTISQFPSKLVYKTLRNAYRAMASGANDNVARDNACLNQLRPETRVDVEYLLKKIRITSLDEYNLGMNVRLADDKRIDWTQEPNGTSTNACDNSGDTATTVKLTPRQIRTFLATYEFIVQ